MKKIFTFFLVLAASMGIVYASNTEVDGIWYDFDSSTKTASVTYRGDNSSHYNEYSGEVIIPENVTYNRITYSVTSIGESAFYGCSSLLSVTIPNSVRSIGEWGFGYCDSLTSITIPNGVTRIRDYTFYDCSSLTSVTIPNSVTSIGEEAFCYCSSLTSVTIPNNVTSIRDYTFQNCSSLTSVTIPNGVTSIGEYAFSGCSSLTSVTIPNSVTSIGDDAFRKCSSLTSVAIPNSVTSIGKSAFSSCSSLTSVTINSDAIVNKAYLSSSNISHIFGSQVTEYIIGDDVNGIGSYAFYGCSSLTSVTIPNSVTSIGDDAFYNCSKLTKTNYTGDIAGWCNIKFGSGRANPMYYSRNFYINDQEIKDLVIPNSVTSIGSYVFNGCSSLLSVTIPISVTSIGESAFYGCSSLTSITITESVTSIGEYAFSDCSSLTSVAIPESVTSIGDYTFEGCSSLTSVTIPNSVTSIGEYAFSGCSSLTSVAIPESVTSIGDYTFEGCSSLTSVTIPNGVTSIGYKVFYGCSSLTSVTIPNGVTSIGHFTFYGCSSLTSVTIPNGVTSIGGSAFEGCSSLTSVAIPNSVTSIGGSAFEGCSSLTSVTIPNNVTSIGDYTFEGCSSLTSVAIPNSVTSIGDYAFEGCSSLTSITIPNGVTSIGDYAFEGCSSLTSVEWNVKNYEDFYYEEAPFNSVSTQITSFIIGDSVQHIPSYLCYEMDNLTSLTIPNSVTSIGDWAFIGCSSLTFVAIGSGVTSIGDDAFKYCSNITSVEWNVKNHEDFYYTEAPFYSARTQITSFIIGDSVQHIPSYLCYGNPLTSLTIPNSVTSIGDYAFEYCSSLTSITIPNSATSIGDYAFRGCSSLTFVAIGSGVTSIGDYAFYDCSNITSVEWNAKNCQNFSNESSTPFYSARTQITSFIIGDSVQHIPSYLCYKMDNLTSLTIPNAVTSIGGYAFYGCSGLTSVTIPNSVTSIGDYAFGGSSSLTSVEWNAKNCQNFSNESSTPFYSARTQITSFIIGDSVQHIPSYLCYWMNNLTSLTIPNSVTSIGKNAFSGCSSLTSIAIPNGVTSIESSTFYKCSSLTSVTIPNSVTSIRATAFKGCSSLLSVTIPNSVTSIGSQVFEGCKKLNEIYCYATEPPVTYWDAFENLSYLYVPCDYLDNYKKDRVFGSFRYIQCIDSEDVTTDDLVVNPGTNDVTITWPIEDGAATYTIMIEKDGKVICTLTFNVDGKLLNIAFAPGRDGNRSAQYAEQTVNGYRFTVTGLDEGSVYTYSLVVKDRENDTIQFYSGEFRTWSVYDRTVMVDYDATQGEVTGAGRYLLGETVTLTAIPNEGSRFVGWGDGNTDNPRTLVVTQDTTLTAIFEVLTYDVTVTCDPTQGTVTGSGTYNHGDIATLTAIPNEGYRFVGWEDDNTDNPRTLVVTQDTTLTAIFEVLTYDVTVTCDPTQGTVTGSGTYNHGDVATLTAIPNEGSQFVGWGDGNTDNPRTLVVTQDITLTALFEVLTYDVTVTCDPTQGTVTGSGTYNHGDVATLTAIPNEGYEFVRWSNEVVVNPYTFVIFENVIITAEFKDVVNTSVENTRTNTSTAKKLLRNGQFIIVRDGVEYNAVGQEM